MSCCTRFPQHWSPLLSLTIWHIISNFDRLLYYSIRQVTKHNYIVVRPGQLNWLNLPHLPTLPPPVTASMCISAFVFESGPCLGTAKIKQFLTGLEKPISFKKEFSGYLFFWFWRFFLSFWYEYQIRMYDAKSHDKRPIHSLINTSPVIEGWRATCENWKTKMTLMNLANHNQKSNMMFIY